jgi:hypothetical protein
MRLPGRSGLGAATLVVVVVAGSAAGSAAGCAGRAEPRVTISAVTPSSAFSNSMVAIVIEGGPFRPIYDLDTSGHETTELGAFTAFLAPSAGQGPAFAADALTWLNTSALAAELEPGVPAGAYDLEVRDPRGSTAQLASAFVSLGPDTTSPTVTIEEPMDATVVNVGASVPVAFDADDGPGYVGDMQWSVSSPGSIPTTGTCSPGPNVHRASCRFTFVVPVPSQNGQPLTVVVTASDLINPPARAEVTLAIGLKPTVTSFTPVEGPAVGGTALTISGTSFIAGTQVLVGGALLQARGGSVMSDTLIQGSTPAHDPGLVAVEVRTGAISVAAGTFEFVGLPQVEAVSPSAGPSAGCTPITIVGKNFRPRATTRVSFGSDPSGGAPLLCATYVSDNRIEGLTPPGTGTVSVAVSDPVGGAGALKLAYTYLDDAAPDAGATPAICPCDGGAP